MGTIIQINDMLLSEVLTNIKEEAIKEIGETCAEILDLVINLLEGDFTEQEEDTLISGTDLKDFIVFKDKFIDIFQDNIKKLTGSPELDKLRQSIFFKTFRIIQKLDN